MNDRIANIKQKVYKLIETGFFSIFISKILANIVVFFGNIVVVRILSKNEYGVYAYAINALNMLFLLNDFGASNAALQNMTEQKNNIQKQQAIFKYATKLAIIGASTSGLLIFLSPLFYPFEIEEARYLVPILCLVPILSIVQGLFAVLLRANFENKKYAILNLIETILSYVFLIPLSIFFGVKGAIVSRYFYIVITMIVGIFLTKKLRVKTEKNNELQPEEKKFFVKYALTTQLNNTIGGILTYIDTFLVGLILSTAESVATYKVASTIPMALSFLPTCVITYVLPYFVVNNKNKEWLQDRYSKLIKYGMIAYGIFTLVVILCSRLIIHILYTDEYMEALYPFIILMIGFFFSATFKIPTDNVLYAIRKLKFNLVITIISGILNIILDVIFIKKFGIIGAAITTSSISILASIMGIFFTRKAFKDMEKNKEEIN